MPEVQIIYISERDIWKTGRAVYKVKKSFEDSNVAYDDGMHVTYVNAAVDDGSEIAKLMNYFKTADPNDMSQGELSKRVHFLKCEEGGIDAMCQITERIHEEGRREGMRQGRKQGKKQGKRQGKEEQAMTTSRNLARMGMPVEKIAEAVGRNVELVKRWIEGEKRMV